jgi:GTP-binding protein Era
MREADKPIKSGFVCIVGRPNSGKSTLLNRLIGEKVSIVTDRPQTTRNVIKGIVTRPEGQIVFLDTPGVHKPIHLMNDRMMKYVRDSMGTTDLLVLIVDASVPFGRGDEFILELLKPISTPKFLLLNKIDQVEKKNLLPIIDHYAKLAAFEQVIPISALTGENVETLLQRVFEHLDEGPMFYPPDQISDQPERAIAAEIVRERLILATREELPYSTAVVVDRFEEQDQLYRIFASIYVERESQKAIIIGKGGQALKEVGSTARRELESFFERKVYLELHVKVKKHWRNDEDTLRNLGMGD